MENVRLNRQADEFRQIIESLSAVSESKAEQAKEDIQVLRHQNLTFTEDFQSERRDREAAQRRVAELEEEVSRLQREVKCLKLYCAIQYSTAAPPTPST